MRYKIIGNGLRVSAAGLGCRELTPPDMSVTDIPAAEELLRDAVECGYTLFDTSDSYGHGHENEKLLGRALEPVRGHVILMTKFGFQWDMTPETIRKALEDSLVRLRTDHVEVYFQHRQNPDMEVEEVASVMGDLIKEGKILGWGLSSVDGDVIRRADRVCHLTAVENRFSMMYRQSMKLLPVLHELHIAMIGYMPLAVGYLSDRYHDAGSFDAERDFRAVLPQFQAENQKMNEDLWKLIHRYAEEKNSTPAQIALSWMTSRSDPVIPIPGTANPEHMRENAAASDIILSEKEIAEIDRALESMTMTDALVGAGNSL